MHGCTHNFVILNNFLISCFFSYVQLQLMLVGLSVSVLIAVNQLSLHRRTNTKCVNMF